MFKISSSPIGFAISAEGDKILGKKLIKRWMEGDVECKRNTDSASEGLWWRERQENNAGMHDTTQPRPLSALIVEHRAPLKQFRAAKKRLKEVF